MSVASDLRRGAGALKTFKKRVDGILDKLDGSPGSAKHIARQEISHSSLKGAGEFFEADFFYARYTDVHENLKRLSRTLGLQIEAMGIAVYAADIGYDNLEDDLRRRFYALQSQISKLNPTNEEKKDAGHEKTTGHQHSKENY
jgi:hypothetical protein